MSNYWPWWLGAIGLAAVIINYTITTDRSFGVSSAWDRVVHWRQERRFERMEEQVSDAALAEALAAATVEQFGPQPVGAHPNAPRPAYSLYADEPYGGRPPRGVDVEPPTGGSGAPAPTLRQPPLISQAVLLLSIFVGGWVAAVTSGHFQIRFDMGEAFSQIVTDKPLYMVGALFGGGVLVGFGTRLAGGCSSGHGLSGCGRLRPVSIVATAVFFGTAIVVSYLLWKVI